MSIFNKGKLSKPQFISKLICALLSVLLFGLLTSADFPGDVGGENGIMHNSFNVVYFITLFFYIVILFRKSLDENLEFEFDENKGGAYFAGVPLLVSTILIVLGVNTIYNTSKFIYNTSHAYHNEYKQIDQRKQTYYDNMWKTYQLKSDIALNNKDVFIEVTKVIMENRKDGAQIAWKWVHENQQIPYNEFTSFYADLSKFIESQRDGYLAIESESQEIAKRNNTLLDTMPNNIYNKFLGVEQIEYKAGFTSTKTQDVFKTGLEDLKTTK